MPEGPSIVIIRDAIRSFKGKKIRAASGSTKNVDFDRLPDESVRAIKSWGKHLLICFSGFTIRLHFLMFGTYRINEKKPNAKPKLSLEFTDGTELNFYTTAIVTIEGNINDFYDWSADVMNKKWNAAAALKKLKNIPDTLICDALLDQQIFSGVGNIIKNEVLFNVRVSPKSKTGKIPLAKKKAIVKEAVRYTFDFLKWKRAETLKQHWQAYGQKKCPRDQHPFLKEYLGVTKRRSFYCSVCQKTY